MVPARRPGLRCGSAVRRCGRARRHGLERAQGDRTISEERAWARVGEQQTGTKSKQLPVEVRSTSDRTQISTVPSNRSGRGRIRGFSCVLVSFVVLKCWSFGTPVTVCVRAASAPTRQNTKTAKTHENARILLGECPSKLMRCPPNRGRFQGIIATREAKEHTHLR